VRPRRLGRVCGGRKPIPDLPTFSLVVPCFNAERYLPQLRQEIDALSPPFDEVLLVDDFSSDRTASVARALGFRVHQLEENRGPGGARNAGAELATGEWLHFLDADDSIAPDYLARLSHCRFASLDLILSAGTWVSEESGDLLQDWLFDDRALQEDAPTELFRNPAPVMCSLIRRSAFERIGGFCEDLRCWEDGDLHLRLAADGARCHAVVAALSTSRRHGRGASGSHRYCHRCRLEFIRRYIAEGLPISTDVLASELGSLGFLLFSAGDWRLALGAYKLGGRLGLGRATSRNKVFDMILRASPHALGRCLSTAVKVGVSRIREASGR